MAKHADDHNYKGYIVRLLYSTGNGGRWVILKLVKGKAFTLRDERWNYITPEHATRRATNYIDNFEDRLILSLKKRFIDYAEKVAAKPGNYAKSNIDVAYYLKAHNTIKTKNITV